MEDSAEVSFESPFFTTNLRHQADFDRPKAARRDLVLLLQDQNSTDHFARPGQRRSTQEPDYTAVDTLQLAEH